VRGYDESEKPVLVPGEFGWPNDCCFPAGKLLVGSGTSTTVVNVARSNCIGGGFPADKMLICEYLIDNGMFGFGGTATVKFEADRSCGPDVKPKMEPLVLRVELRRPMNLLAWEVVGVKHEP
jgi:hypothetical protein